MILKILQGIKVVNCIFLSNHGELQLQPYCIANIGCGSRKVYIKIESVNCGENNIVLVFTIRYASLQDLITSRGSNWFISVLNLRSWYIYCSSSTNLSIYFWGHIELLGLKYFYVHCIMRLYDRWSVSILAAFLP